MKWRLQSALCRRIVVFALFASAQLGSHGALTAEPVSPKVVAQLQQANFADALAELRRRPEAEQRERAEDLDRLDFAITLASLANENATLGRRADVEKFLGELQRLEVRSAPLAYREGVLRLSQRLQERLRQRDELRSLEQLGLADELLARDELNAASAIYKSLLEAPDDHSPSIVQRARLGMDAISRARTHPRIEWAQAKSALVTLATWVAMLVFAWLVLRAIRAVLALFPRRMPCIELDEPDAQDRMDATRELVALLMDQNDVGRGMSLDSFEDLDRSGLANIHLATRDTEAFKEIVSNTERISVAGISFTPQQLYALVLPLRRPFEAEYGGELRRTDKLFRISLRIRDDKPGTFFSCEAATRDEALAETADYIAFRSSSWQVSSDWRSFRAYRKALRLLATPDLDGESELWLTARGLLEEAIDSDPSNVVALYRLGVTLRRVGNNGDATGILTRLDDQLHDPNPPAWLADFVKRNSDFKRSVRYDLALCLAKQDGFDNLARAESLLSELEVPPRRERGPDPEPPGRFALLASSAMAAISAARLGLEALHVSREEKQQWLAGRAKEVCEQLTERRLDIEAYRRDPRLKHARVCGSAFAVALAAEGRALFVRRMLVAAEATLRRACAENPKLACAAIHLAQVLKEANKRDVAEPIRLLKRALELSPRNVKANYLLGQIHHTALEQHDVALTYLEAARRWGTNAAADLVYAQCLQSLKRDREALAVLERSIHSIVRPVNYRYELYLALLKNVGALSPEQLKEARRAYGLIRQFFDASDVRRCEKIMVALGLETSPVEPHPDPAVA